MLPGVVSSVPPAKLEYSPAEREVGMETMGTVGGWMEPLLGLVAVRLRRSDAFWMLFARAYTYQRLS